MTCSFCGSRNDEGASRCRKCGRRPEDSLNAALPVARTDGALAAKLRPADFETPEAGAQRHAIRGVQQALFADRNSNVVPIAMYAPPRAEVKPPQAKPAQRKAAQRRRPTPEGQGSLDFLPPEPPKPRTLSTTVEAMVSCSLPVATLQHRAVAAAIDWMITVGGYGIFLIAYFMLGGEFSFNRTTFLVFLGALLMLGFAYGVIWTLAGADTAGMRITGLKVVTFEGYPLERRHRIMRLVGACLSLCTVVGHLWSMADEESLTWHDHMSRTFPTPRRIHAEVFRQI